MHEKTIHFGLGGRYFVIPTILGDRELEPEEAVKLFRQGAIRPLGQFSTEIEARRWVENRSKKHQ